MAILTHESHGSGDGPAVVLLHGFPLDRRIWSRVAPLVAPVARVIAIDLRGFGHSRDFEPFTITSQADDVREVLAELGALPAILGGLSMGGYISLAFARRYQADLAGLLLIDTRAEADTNSGKAARDKMIELVQTSGPSAVAEQMLPKMLAHSTVQSSPDVVDQLMGIMENCSAVTIEHALLAMRDREDQTDLLSSITVPTRIIVGHEDQITMPVIATEMKKRIPNSDLVEIWGAGHLSPMEQPEKVAAAIVEFVQSLGEEERPQ